MRPDFTSARLLAAEIQSQAGRPAAAESVLAAVPQSDPLIALVQLRQAQYADRAGDAAKATAMLEQLAAHYPQRPEPLKLLAEMQRAQNHFEDAAETYGRAIARIPQAERRGLVAILRARRFLRPGARMAARRSRFLTRAGAVAGPSLTF